MTVRRTPRSRRLTAALALGGALLCAATGCATATASSEGSPQASAPPSAAPYEQLQAATLRPGQPVPVPVGKPVLTLRGRISSTNVGEELRFDLATLERLGLVAYSVDDRQAEGRVVRFSGVLLKSPLDVAGAAPDATVLHTTALNDYSVDIPSRDASELPVLLATRADGVPMTVEHYGPTRVVYPTSAFDLPAATYDPRWIWQLASIEVR